MLEFLYLYDEGMVLFPCHREEIAALFLGSNKPRQYIHVGDSAGSGVNNELGEACEVEKQEDDEHVLNNNLNPLLIDLCNQLI